MFDTFWPEVRYAVRSLGRKPVAVVTAIAAAVPASRAARVDPAVDDAG